MKRNVVRFMKILVYGLVTLYFYSCTESEQKSARVILIGIDGMGTDGFQQAITPNLDALVREGALSLKTRSVMPTVSAPNWASHLLGAGPEQHGITHNGWTTTNRTVDPVEQDVEGYFPSIFTLIRQQRPAAKTGFFYDWDALADLVNTSTIDEVQFSKTYTETFEKAIPWILANRPVFTFIYIGYPDEVGHEHQWGSKQYLHSLEVVDAALGDFFRALKEEGIYEETTILVVTDHGGVGYGHGGLSMAEIEVPWIISGPGTITNRMISQPNDVFNTASTIAYLLGLEQPYSWIGRPVRGALAKDPMSFANREAYIPQPFSTLPGGIYPESQAFGFTVAHPGAQIRFTTNGQDPDRNSPLYQSPILLMKSTLLKAASFEGESSSRITTVDFVKAIPVKNVQLNFPPSGKYSGGNESLLTDHSRGTGDYRDGRWLGFEGVNLESLIDLGSLEEIKQVRIGYLHSPYHWIFAPKYLEVKASVQGDHFVTIGNMGFEKIYEITAKGRNEIQLAVTPSKARFLKISLENTGICPSGHPGEGKAAWLFVDEISIE